ncbi:MAG: RIP metalloprotease RseP [Gloeomargarita sp. SKYG116]|nr:RIP metalloprotease RseP [Gloeomargarita sp. SKYG116]MCS7226130.1 RIP metalloprotease RseP [Gloeomargarita sp. SKYB31]MDW8402305.1 RIP metalloprotease RseP [Gloeomargarita sp. SKYGB_i_bin116]
MSILAAIGVLAILVCIHELGHFGAARLLGIRVSQFSLGFGPALWSYQGKDVLYAVRAIPLGGYVGFPDDDPDSDIPSTDPDLLRNRPIGDRAWVMVAGVLANLVFAYVILTTQVLTVGIPHVVYQPGVRVPQIAVEMSPVAQRAGLKAGDVIVAVDGERLPAGKTAVQHVVQTIQSRPHQPVRLEIQRQATRLTVTVVPELAANGRGRIGVQLQENVQVETRRARHLLEGIVLGAQEFYRLLSSTLRGYWELVQHFQQTADQVAGPVAIVAMGAGLARSGWVNLLQFSALISINLAVINILPLPALDGGQLLLLGIEALRGRPLPPKVQEGVMQTGLLLLLGLGVFLIIRDTVRLVGS